VTRLWPYDSPPMPGLLRAAADADAPRHALAVERRKTAIGAICDAIDVLAMTVDPDVILIGGGMAKTGEPLLEALRAELRARGRTSPFIRSLDLPSRIELAFPTLPVGAIGAALVGEGAAHGHAGDSLEAAIAGAAYAAVR
ncbi:MAG: hypothetical protein UHD09_04400, partial [Bifidobacterium sp.]|nr:hypothetical protein [Bifidobacterium sp.]